MTEREPVNINPTKEATRNVTPLTEAEQKNRGWKLIVNKSEIPSVSSVKLANEKMGISAEYGKTEAGYDGLALEEAGGGGSVIVPWTVTDGELYVGVVEENRPNAGGKVLNVPRGFLTPGETHFQTAKRELREETGYIPMENRIREIGGEAMNPNSTFFVTKGSDKGVKPFEVAVNPSEVRLVQPSNNPSERIFGFNTDVIKPVSKTGEKVMKSQFIHWSKAMELKDMFTVASVGRLATKQFTSRS